MLKISDAVRDLVEGNPALHFGMHHRLLNLSQVARFVQPMVEARTRKTVKVSAILMSLSRLQKRLRVPPDAGDPPFHIDRINVHAGLCALTVAKSRETHRALNELFSRIQEDEGYVTITEGNTEITAIVESRHLPLAGEILPTAPREVQRNIAGLGVQFEATYTEKPGLLYQLLQQAALQNINVVEVASTRTEFNIYLHDADLMLAFDAIYNRFCRERRL